MQAVLLLYNLEVVGEKLLKVEDLEFYRQIRSLSLVFRCYSGIRLGWGTNMLIIVVVYFLLGSKESSSRLFEQAKDVFLRSMLNFVLSSCTGSVDRPAGYIYAKRQYCLPVYY